MALTRIADVLPDPVLTGLAVDIGTGGPYIADLIAPVATVQKDSFKYAKWDRGDIKLDVKSKRAPGDPAASVELTKTFVTASVAYRGLKSRIADEIRGNDPNPGTLEQRRTKVLTNKLRLEIEDAVAALCQAASNTKAAPATKWDAATPTIRKNIIEAKDAFRKQAGMEPNVMVLPPSVRNAVFSDEKILDLIRYTNPKFLADGQIPVIENMQVVIPGAVVDASNPGASLSIADVWNSDEVYFLFVDQTAGDDLEALTALRQVRSLATTGSPLAAYRWRDADASAHSDWVGVDVNQAEIVVASEFILRLLDVLT